MGFFWKKPQGGNMQTQSKHLTNSCILDELGTNKHTLFDACLVMPNHFGHWQTIAWILSLQVCTHFSGPTWHKPGESSTCLHPGATTGRQAVKQGVAWLTLLSSFSKEAPDGPLPSCWLGLAGLRLLVTGWALVLTCWRDIGGASQLLSEDDLQDSLPVYLLARAARQWVCKSNWN